jgi:hypothetical protein
MVRSLREVPAEALIVEAIATSAPEHAILAVFEEVRSR